MSRDPQQAGQRLHGCKCMSVKPGNCLGVGSGFGLIGPLPVTDISPCSSFRHTVNHSMNNALESPGEARAVSGEKVVLDVPVKLPLSVIRQDLGISGWTSTF